MSRELLPQRRRSETLTFQVRGIVYCATCGFYPDSRLAEVFLDAAKVGTDVQIAAHDSAVALSFALQFGARASDLRSAMMRDASGDPEGPLGHLLDLLAVARLEDRR